MYRSLTLVLLSFWSQILLAQVPYSIKGSVEDTSVNMKLFNASISVLDGKDSILLDFAWTDKEGTFNINNLPGGKLIILIYYNGYADYVEHFNLDSTKNFRDFGKMSLVQKARLLEEVIIKGTIAIKIKGDTTEFNASSYKIQPNDRVEDLLKQLPGIQVDQDGRITARGKPVNKVLVDGEEFFGDDPTLVTRNIRADMVDKVQLFDKSSDQAAFTGVDDGKRTRTINITLKADRKSGYFGKLDGGGASNKYYQGQGMFNYFQTKQKFSAYGTIGNTNRTGLSSQDNNRYGTTGNISYLGQGDLLESFTGRYTGEGLPSAQTGGVHFDAKWNSDKQSINLNYRIGTINVDGQKNIFSVNNFPLGLINSHSFQSTANTFSRQKVDATYQAALNASSTLKIVGDIALSKSETNTTFLASNKNESEVLLNSQDRQVQNNADIKTINISALLNKKFKQPGRTISIGISHSYSDNRTKGYLNSINNFYNSQGVQDSSGVVDQFKPTVTTIYSFISNLVYTHPLSKLLSLALNYELNANSNTLENTSFNQSIPGTYDVFDKIFSSNFKRGLTSNQAGVTFTYAKMKTNFRFGTSVSSFDDQLTDLITNKEYNRNYVNWTPGATYRYQFSQQRNFFFQYSRSTVQPTTNQLQPIKVNIDPINITLGNSSLKPSFNNSFIAIYQSAGLSGQSFMVDAGFFLIENPIISSTLIDPVGKSTYQFVNLRDRSSSNYYLSLSMSWKLKKSDVLIQFNPTSTGAITYSFSNNALNQISSQDYSPTVTFSKSVVRKYSWRLSYAPSYRFNKSSLQEQTNNGWVINASGTVNLFLPGKMQIGTTANYLFHGKTQTFRQNFNRLLLSTTLTKKFLKKENLGLSLTGNDLLNQNTGLVRNISGTNMFLQSEYLTIKRYVMLSLTWDFTKMEIQSK